jgi:hypothetical protein
LAVAMMAGVPAAAQVSPDGAWQFIGKAPASVQAQEPWIRPEVSRTALLDVAALRKTLAAAPLEFTGARPLEMSIPMPNGTFARFSVVESPIMEPGLAAQFPEIKTYAGQGIDDPAATVRFDITPQGFHSQILSPNGAAYIDPYSRANDVVYSVYYKKDLRRRLDGWTCTVDGAWLRQQFGSPDTPSGTTLRTFRLANACTGEYAQFHGGTVASAQAAIVTAINRVTGVYEVECAIRMVLVANNSSIVYTNASTDPYTNNNGSTMLGQNQTTCDSVIGNANYDIGHVFSTGGGGVAGLGVVGITGQKARGVTGLPSPTGDPFYIDYVAHEMGHQYGSNHSFNGTGGSCSGNRSGANAYEPGSASTIMGYAGICGADNLQNNSDPYFLWDSHDDILAFINGSIPGVGTSTATGNGVPTVNGGLDYNIPANTPFLLTASGSDPNGDALTYCWEPRDLGAALTLAAGDNGTSPIIRSWNPTTSPSRMIPRLSNLLNNTLAVGERLPTTTRTLRFTVSVRDNRSGGGGWNSDNVDVFVTNTGAAFAVTSPNTAVSWPGGSTQTVTWNVAGTTASPINCANVAIELSTDGGNTFPVTLLASTPNDGSETVTIPNTPTSLARVRVRAVGNIFFDISNANFTISAPVAPPNNNCSTPTVVGVGSTPFTTVNATTDGPPEPGCSFCCGDTQINQDVWFRFTAPCTGTVSASLCGSTFDTKIAIYEGLCPVVSSAAACNDDSNFCGAGSVQSAVTFQGTAGSVYTIRVGGFNTATGTGNLLLSCTPAPSCYANCDGSTGSPLLTSNDFQCFLNKFAAGDTYANCDGSTGTPLLTSNDFQCFLNKFAAGCT